MRFLRELKGEGLVLNEIATQLGRLGEQWMLGGMALLSPVPCGCDFVWANPSGYASNLRFNPVN